MNRIAGGRRDDLPALTLIIVIGSWLVILALLILYLRGDQGDE